MTSKLFKIVALLCATFALLASPAQASDEDAVVQATKAYLKKENPGVQAKIKTEKIDGEYARASVTAEGLDTATVYLKKENAEWKVLSLGTGFGPEDYKEMGIPKSLQQ